LVSICIDVRNALFLPAWVGILGQVGDEWIRPYTPGTGRWLVIGWEAVALGLLGWSTVEQFGLAGPGVRPYTRASGSARSKANLSFASSLPASG